MNKNTSLSKATAWYTIGNLFIRSVSFLLLPLYSNLIPPSEFGNYSLIMALYAIIAVLYYSGLQSALSKFYLEQENELRRKEIFSTIFNSVLITGFILTLIIFFTSGWIAKSLTGSAEYSGLIRIIFTALFFESLGYITIHLLRTKELARKVVIYSSSSAVINLLLNIYFVYLMGMGIYGIILAQLITGIFLFAILLPSLKENYMGSFNPKLIRIIFTFTIPIVSAGILSASVDVIDRFIINHFLGNAEVGIYSFSYRIALVMNIFVLSLRSAWTPYSIRLYHAGNYSEVFGKTFTKILAVGLLIFLIVSLFIDDLFNLNIHSIHLFNPEYKSGISIIPVILISYLFSVVITYFSVYPYISSKSIHFLISDTVAFIINIILNFTLIPYFGIMGAAIATFFSYFGAAIYLITISGYKIKIDYEPLKVILILIITAVSFLTSKLIDLFYADIILFIVSFIIIYKLAGLKAKLFPFN